MYNPQGLMFDDYKDVEQSERCGNDDTEITGQDGRGMIVNKGRPTLIRHVTFRLARIVLCVANCF
jgi:hypothetical protein